MVRRIKNSFANQKTAHKILLILLAAVILPITLVILVVCTVWSNVMISRTNALMESRMNMSQKSLEDYFTTYENIIMDSYTTNQYASDLERLNLMDMQNYFSIRYRVEKSLQNTAYLYPGILGISLCSQKFSIHYDSLTRQGSSSYCFSEKESTWQELAQESQTQTQTLYKAAWNIVPDKQTAEEQINVVYVAHRLVDLNNYAKGTIGSILICIDEKNIRPVYSQDDTQAQLSYLCDAQGNIVSCSKEKFIGYNILSQGDAITEENAVFLAQQAVFDYHMMDTKKCLVYMRPICNGEFFQISIQDENELFWDLNYIVTVIILIGIMTILTGGIITVRFADHIERNMQKIIMAMDEAYNGNYSVQIENNRHDEFGTISRQFNHMVRQIKTSVQQEKEALVREKNAEIKALEAQINPHFLYNTLDAINWIAIENEQFRISKMLKDLAIILRYSIQKSNSMVTLEDEIEYLKKYILLQQQRFDFSFKCFLDIDESARNCKVHKLLFQPLVENAIVHGFPGRTGEDIIKIQVNRQGEDKICIVVSDNGKGMDAKLVNELNHFDFRNNTVENSIGMRNVFMRVKYYYGEKGDFAVQSNENGTKVSLWILFQK